MKVDAKVTKIYNDSVFGGIAWSRDGKKIVLIGETPAVAKFEPFFKDPEEEKKDGDAPKHFQDDKFVYKENYGEMLGEKSKAGIFVFDIEQNKINQVKFGKHL